jgi:polar amino acid transport system substrate-binding protein
MAALSSSSSEPAACNLHLQHGFDLDYPPYSYRNDNGEYRLHRLDMAQPSATTMAVQYEAVPFNWDAKDAELNAGSCDCIGLDSRERVRTTTWSMPYSDNTQILWSTRTPVSPPWLTSPLQ